MGTLPEARDYRIGYLKVESRSGIIWIGTVKAHLELFALWGWSFGGKLGRFPHGVKCGMIFGCFALTALKILF